MFMPDFLPIGNLQASAYDRFNASHSSSPSVICMCVCAISSLLFVLSAIMHEDDGMMLHTYLHS